MNFIKSKNTMKHAQKGSLILLASFLQFACSPQANRTTEANPQNKIGLNSGTALLVVPNTFSLINAQTNSEQALDGISGDSSTLSDGATLYLGSVGIALNIRANFSSVGSVRFGYDGQPAYHIENVAPYAFASDSQGIYNSWTPSIGTHVMTATSYSASNATGTAGQTVTINFTVSSAKAPLAQTISGCTLINAKTNLSQPLDGIAGHSAEITDNAFLDLSKVGQALNIRADLAAAGSVLFDYDNGAINHVENVAPYAMASDNRGIYNSWTPASGAHTLKVTAYSGANATGTAGATITRNFMVGTIAAATPAPVATATPKPVATATPAPPLSTPFPPTSGPSVGGATLINANTDAPQSLSGVAGQSTALNDNSSFDLAKTGQALNVRADTTNAVSVKFDLDAGAMSRIENTPPYALASDSGGNYNAWTPSVGSHTLKMTAYSAANATGTASATLTLRFNVTNSGTISTPAPMPTATPAAPAGTPSAPVSGNPVSTTEPSSYSAPIVITQGGTSSGNWRNTAMGWDSYAVKIATQEPVILQNCHLAGPGILINARYASANLTVRNCSFHGYAPIVDNQPRGRAIDMTTFKNIVVENNYFENTGTPVAAIDYRGNGTTDTIKVRFNRVRNINGKYRNSDVEEHNMFQNFVSVQGFTYNPPNAEIGWNDVINEPGKSASEDLINFHRSGGQPGSWFKVHDNFMRGSYHPNPYDGNGSGGGVQIDGEDNATASNIEVYGNTIMQIMNGGMGAAAGSNVYMHHNRVISSGKDSAGTWWLGSHAAVWIFDFYHTSPSMSNIRIEQNVFGWAHQGAQSQLTGEKDRFDYDSNLLNGIQNNTELPAGAITEATQNNEYQMYLNKVSAAGVNIGPQK